MGLPSRTLTPEEEAQRHQNKLKAYGLRLAGHSHTQIAEVLGCSIKTVGNYIREAYRELEHEEGELVARQELDRLDVALRSTVEVLRVSTAAGDADGVLKAVDRLVKVSESRRKLLGLDKERPDQEIPQEEVELRRIIREYRIDEADIDLKAEKDLA